MILKEIIVFFYQDDDGEDLEDHLPTLVAIAKYTKNLLGDFYAGAGKLLKTTPKTANLDLMYCDRIELRIYDNNEISIVTSDLGGYDSVSLPVKDVVNYINRRVSQA